MNRDQWATLEPLLDTLLDLPVEERAGWLETLARESPERARRLRALLDAETDADRLGFLSAPINSSLAGMQLGPWRLERSLGQGGMGTVWLARRADGHYEGEAAVKILNLALLSPSGQERFRREGSVLARLTHPNIARLLDAGVASAGQPYLVLERVDGVTIDDFARDHGLSRTARIELFLQVLAAVGHAHAHLVVHRDIKPSNILVTHDGSVKLLDFGIAKLLSDGTTGEHSIATLEGRHLTPRYAAPEQVRDEPLTTATDVYALGVLLYLLLSGRHPTGETARTPAEAIRAVLDDEPQRLGLGDLDNILAKAMRKRPAERYQSVAALGDDLRRYLREEPVSARPHSLAYRAKKFVRRNRGSVVAAALVLVTMIVATIVTTRQMLEAQRQRDAARTERDNALFQERQATASSGFMESLLQTIAPTGRAYTMQELLEQARLLLEQDFREDPRFQARMMNELSDQYFTLHDRQHELPLLTRAEELAVAANDYAVAAYSACRLGKSAADDGKAAIAGADLLRGRRYLARADHSARDAEVQCLRGESALERLLGHTDVALNRARRAVALGALAGDTLSFSHLSAINELARALHDDDQVRQSLDVTRQVLGLLVRTGRSHTLTALVEQYNEGALLARLGEPRAADSALNLAELLSDGMGPENRRPVYMTLLDGELAGELGRPARALELLQTALTETERREDRPYQERALADLAELKLEQGALGDADGYFARLKRLAPDSTNWSTALLGARLQFAHGDHDRARKRYMDVLVSRGFPDKGRSTSYFARLVLEAARMALASGDLAAADSLATHTLRIARNEGHVDSLSTVIEGAEEVREAVERARGA
ncbi:MAG TPA: protein kinase [Gemmatimonadales bacterium]|nr:protein kinase [Gemmatimonadales bacterium]